MATWDIQPSKPPDQYPYLLPPPRIMNSLRDSGASDTQIIAVYRYVIEQTFAEVQAGETVVWPNVGTWFRAHYTRTSYRNPNTGATTPMEPKYRIQLRPDWRFKR